MDTIKCGSVDKVVMTSKTQMCLANSRGSQIIPNGFTKTKEFNSGDLEKVLRFQAKRTNSENHYFCFDQGEVILLSDKYCCHSNQLIL